MKSTGFLIAALATSTVLSACSSGGTGAGGSAGVVSRAGNSDADAVLAVDAGNAAQALQDEETLTASQRASSAILRNFDAETAAVDSHSTATVRRNAAGGLDLVVDGRTISFAASDLTEDGYGYELADGSAGIWAWSADSMAEALDPENGQQSLVFDYFADGEGSTGKNGFVVVGSETEAAALAALPTASYDGWMRLRMGPTTGFDSYSADVSEARGDVAMTANFGAGTVAGAVTNMESRAPRDVDPTRTWTPFSGGLTMQEAGISGNGFTGAISGDAGFNANVGTLAAGSTYSGTFFGTGAQEVGGGISTSGTVGSAPSVGFGVWQAWQD